MPLLSGLRDWSPFQIDALGIVTLIGANEVGVAFGRLATNRYTRFLPTVGSYVFAAKGFMVPLPGFQVYCIDDFIFTTDVPGWFARWLLSQKLECNATKIDVTYEPARTRWAKGTTAAASLAIVAHVPAIVLSALIGDWWGFAAATLMAASTVSRWILIEQNRLAIDENARAAIDWYDGPTIKTSFWILPTGEAVTIRAPKGLLVNCLLTNPKIDGPVSYFARALGWGAFCGFVVSLGMACLFIQLFIVSALLGGTLAVVFHIGDDDQTIRISVKIRSTSDPLHSDHRAEAYFRLDANKEQEDAMVRWSLFPQRTNEKWWRCYEHCKKEGVSEFKRWGELYAQY